MRFIFDIDENNHVSVSLAPVNDSEDINTPTKTAIEHPVRDFYRLKDEGFYKDFSDKQLQILLDKAFILEPFFNQPTNLCKLLEQLVEKLINEEVHT